MCSSMKEHVSSSNSELIVYVPGSVHEAFDLNPELMRGVNEASKESHDAVIADLFNKQPHKDTDKNGWLWFLGYSYLGYANQQMLIDGRDIFILGGTTGNITEKNFTKALQSQLAEDAPHWGDTWKKRTIEGQLERTYQSFRDYKDKYENGNEEFPWLKVAGGIIINLYRIDHPDYQK